MQGESRDRVLALAADVRSWAEAAAFGTYKEGDLNGMCAIASAELWRRLDAAGIKAAIRVWVCEQDGESTHVFLCVDDHVLDVTATQFKGLRKERIYFEHEKEAEGFRFYCHSYEFRNPEELVSWQEEVGFMEDQVAWV